MKKTAKFCSFGVDPGALRHFVIELPLGENEDFFTLQGLQLEKAASNFVIVDLSWVYEDRSGSLSSSLSHSDLLPPGDYSRYDLPNVLLPRGAHLQAKVRNVSATVQIFQGEVSFETITGEIEEESKPSLVERCKQWFVAGLEVAARDRISSEKKPPSYLSLPSVRESVRQIVASLASLVELPALAASLYWRSLSEAGLSEADSVDDPQPIAIERVSFPVDMFVAPNLGKRRYRIGDDGVKKIDLLGEWLTFTVHSIGETEYEVDVILMPGTLIERVVGDRRTIAGT